MDQHLDHAHLHWIERKAWLNFRLGDLHLFEVEIDVTSPSNFFADLESTVQLDLLTPKDGRVILINSLPVQQEPERIRVRDDAIQYVPRTYHRHMTDLRQDPEAVLARRSRKTRYNLKRTVRTFGEQFGNEMKFHDYSSVSDVRPFLEGAWNVSRKTYQERLLDAGLPSDEGFIGRTRNFAAQGGWRGFLLIVREQPIAYIYVYIRDGIARYAYIGFDPAYAKWSPGTVLQWHMLQRLAQQHFAPWLDYTQGDGHHKELFATHTWQCADVWLFPRNVRNRLLLQAHTATDRTADFVGQALARLNLKTRVRRLLRKQVR